MKRGIAAVHVVIIVLALIIIAGGAYYLGKGSGNANSTTTTSTDENTTESTANTPSATTKTTSTKVTPTKTSGSTTMTIKSLVDANRSVVCEAKTSSAGISITLYVNKGSFRVTQKVGNLETNTLYTNGTAYVWNNTSSAVLAGPTAATSVNAIMQLPLIGYTCSDKTYTDNIVFTPPAH